MPTLQANLRRSPGDAARLAQTGMPILLVKGAHVEPPELAHGWGEDTDLAFIGLAHQLHAAGAELAIGTHDPVIREALLASFESVRFEMLLGVRPEMDGHSFAAGNPSALCALRPRLVSLLDASRGQSRGA